MAREELTASHVVAAQVNKRARRGCAIHWHADTGSISLALVVNEESGEKGVATNSLCAGNSQKQGSKAHFERIGRVRMSLWDVEEGCWVGVARDLGVQHQVVRGLKVLQRQFQNGSRRNVSNILVL